MCLDECIYRDILGYAHFQTRSLEEIPDIAVLLLSTAWFEIKEELALKVFKLSH